jgi:hypothetical protein
MATQILHKFSDHLPTIREAISGDTDLRTNQKLYKKIYKYYKNLGVIFTGDSNIDYDTVLDYLYEDVY